MQISEASKIHNCFIPIPERGEWGEMAAKNNLCLHDLLVYCSPTVAFSLEGSDVTHQVNIQLEPRGSPGL